MAGYFLPISPPEGEVDFPILKDKIRSLALPTSPTSVASLVAGVLFVLAIGSKRDSDSKLGFLFWCSKERPAGLVQGNEWWYRSGRSRS